MWMLIILVILLAIMPSNKAKTKHRNNNRFNDEPFYEEDDDSEEVRKFKRKMNRYHSEFQDDIDFSKEDDEFFEDLIMFDEIDDED